VPTPAGQRSLDLDARLPLPPNDLRPMLSRSARKLTIDDDRVVDPTWGGLRILASAQGGHVRLSVGADDVAHRFPDVVASLRSLDLPGAVLDGEIVVPGTVGHATADAMRHRGPIRPATLVVSDLPWLAGRLLLAEALERRRARLAELAIAAPSVVVLEPARGAGAVLQLIALHGLVGVVAKRADSPYLPGTRSRLWTLIRVADVMADGAAGSRVVLDGAAADGVHAPVRPDIALLRTLPFDEDA
jgi:bifunctional non-homologous end joining protein LigD